MSGLSDVFEELGELDQSNIGSWPTWAHIGLLIIVAAAILGAGSWYFVQPKQEQLEQIQQKELELQQTFINKHEQVASLDDYRAQVATMREQFGEQLSQLPTQTEIPSLLNDISQMRLASGLEEEIFKPRAPIMKDFYVILPNAMTVTGQYHELADFVSRVASLPRIVTIENVEIKPVNDASEGTLRMSMTVNTYRYIGDDNDDDNGDKGGAK